MKRQYSLRVLLIKLATWLLVELLLTWVGLDNLADYGEFALSRIEFSQLHGAIVHVQRGQPSPLFGIPEVIKL